MNIKLTMRYTAIPSTLFIKNRTKVLAKMPENSTAIIFSNPQIPRNGDLYYPYRQNSDFFYLTGIEQEKSILILTNIKSNAKAILFLIDPKPELEQWEGEKLSKEKAKNISGISNILSINIFEKEWDDLAYQSEHLLYNKNCNPRLQTDIKFSEEIFSENLHSKWVNKDIFCISSILAECRSIKEPEEVELIQKACNITKDAFIEILHKVKPNMYEYELEAIMTGCFIRNGAKYHAFEPIIANGKNTCYLHYIKNDQRLESGNLVSMDFGSEYANYASDCTRSFPVNGLFSDRQKEIYNAVYRVFKNVRKLIVPGARIADYQKTTCLLIQEELLSLGILTKDDIRHQSNDKPAYFKYFMHGVSHFIGLDTHDVGDRFATLQPGMVVSCEPGIYIFEENIGIRIEDTILVTENGNIDLMNNIPIEPEEIEEIMHN